MKLHSLLIALALAGTASAASAQGALYINPVAIRVSTSTPETGTFAFLGNGASSRIFYGVDFGGFYDIPTQVKSIEVGIDLRDQILHGNNALLTSFLVGPRIAFAPFNNRFHPYVEPVVGVGTTRAPYTAIKVDKLQYGVFAGADFYLNSRITWRAVEVGYSSLTTASGGTVAAAGPVNSSSLLNISTGLTFRLP